MTHWRFALLAAYLVVLAFSLGRDGIVLVACPI